MKINFNAGPAALPKDVLTEASKAILEYEQTGISILGLAHRSQAFKDILVEAKSLALQLLGLDDTYDVIWFQGGGRMQFELIPMNFLKEDATAAYIDSGHWAADAMNNVARYGKLHIAGSTKSIHYKSVPRVLDIPQNAAYLHLTANNTIYGTQLSDLPVTEVPLIGDFSSEIFSRRLDYAKFSMIYAVAQKNLGPAGATMVVAKKSFLEKQVRALPEILSYKSMAAKNSLVNTAPVFAIYVSLLNLRYLASKGLAQIEIENNTKAKLMYDFLDQSNFYEGVAHPDSRSAMNVCFTIKDPAKEESLLAFAEEAGITGIAGHRSVGGFRASIYNAISIADVEHLIAVLSQFENNL
jgi:phosphoserine aminotransferase